MIVESINDLLGTLVGLQGFELIITGLIAGLLVFLVLRR
jgi:hypothetical protein